MHLQTSLDKHKPVALSFRDTPDFLTCRLFPCSEETTKKSQRKSKKQRFMLGFPCFSSPRLVVCILTKGQARELFQPPFQPPLTSTCLPNTRIALTIIENPTERFNRKAHQWSLVQSCNGQAAFAPAKGGASNAAVGCPKFATSARWSEFNLEWWRLREQKRSWDIRRD